jgi:hypothetical protein
VGCRATVNFKRNDPLGSIAHVNRRVKVTPGDCEGGMKRPLLGYPLYSPDLRRPLVQLLRYLCFLQGKRGQYPKFIPSALPNSPLKNEVGVLSWTPAFAGVTGPKRSLRSVIPAKAGIQLNANRDFFNGLLSSCGRFRGTPQKTLSTDHEVPGGGLRARLLGWADLARQSPIPKRTQPVNEISVFLLLYDFFGQMTLPQPCVH